MRTTPKFLSFATALGVIALTGLGPSPAEARDYHNNHGHHRGWDRGRDHDHYRRDRHSHSSFSISFGQWVEPAPTYIPTYSYVPTQAPVQYVETTYTTPVTTEGRYCREYNTISQVAGRAQNTYGTACLQPDGSWQIVD